MATEIVLPQWGMEMQDGTVVRWLKQEGDPIQEGEPLVEIETSKLETEMESIASGVLARILVAEGDTVPIRTVLAIVAAQGEEVPVPQAVSPASPVTTGTSLPAAPTKPGDRPHVQVVPAARRLAQQHGIDLGQVTGTGPGGRIVLDDVQRAIEAQDVPAPRPLERLPGQVVPAARRLASQHGIDLGQVRGTGTRGRILIEDVERAVGARAQQATRVVPIKGMRQTIARRMLESLQAMAQLTLTTEADVTDAMRLREGLARQWAEGGLSPLALVVKATARALREHPRMNALQNENEVQLMEEVNVGVAVALEEGLIVPTIRQADAKSLSEIAKEARGLASKTREGRASYDEVTGATFTITNLGAHAIDAFTPIINPPQVGILGMGRVVEKPAVHQGEIVKRSLMYLSLTFDHRVIDGAPAAEFLSTVKDHLEDPWWMVASV